MLFPVLKTNDWLDNAFNDFFDTRALGRMNATAPAVNVKEDEKAYTCLLYTSPSPRDKRQSRMPSSA